MIYILPIHLSLSEKRLPKVTVRGCINLGTSLLFLEDKEIAMMFSGKVLLHPFMKRPFVSNQDELVFQLKTCFLCNPDNEITYPKLF